MLSDAERDFLARARVARLATADAAGRPHVVPVCHALSGDTVYVTIDGKPKGSGRLKRVRNLLENAAAALVVDHYEEDWDRLGWVMVRGAAEVLASGDEHDRAQALLAGKYPQLRAMDIAVLPVIALRVERTASWGTAIGAVRENGSRG